MHTAAYSTIATLVVAMPCTREIERRKCTILWTHVYHAWKHYYYYVVRPQWPWAAVCINPHLQTMPICIFVFICDVWFSLGQHFKCNPTHFSFSSSSSSSSTSILCQHSLRNWTLDIYVLWRMGAIRLWCLVGAAHELSVCLWKENRGAPAT